MHRLKINNFRNLEASLVKYAQNVCASGSAKTLAETTFPPSQPIGTTTSPPIGTIDTSIKPTSIPSTASTFVKIEHVEPIPKAIPFDDVPGPVLLKKLAKFWSFVPIMGTEVTASTIQYMLSAGKIFGSQLAWGSNLWLFRWLHNEYGPVVRLHGPFGGDVVILSRPEHVKAVFQSEGQYPVRSCLDCVEKYRLSYRRYKHAGPFITSGPEWEHLRRTIEQPLQKSLEEQYGLMSQACDDFVIRILRTRNRQDEVGDGFKFEIYKWCLECLCAVMLNKRVGFLEPLGLTSTSEPSRLMECLNDGTNAIRRCEMGLHLWKFMDTPAWKSLIRNCDTIDGILNKYVQKAQENLRNKKNELFPVGKLSLLENMLLKEGIVPDDVLTIMLDLLIIGMNTTSHTVAFLMYHLARVPRAQYKLFEEIKTCPTNPRKEDVARMKYLQACIKECLRLNPPMPVLSRVLTKDVLVHSYQIPKGTYVMIASHLSSLREEHYEDAAKFKPERWMTPESSSEMDDMASVPFGFGPRACLAKDLVNGQIGLLVAKLLQKFRIEYHYGDIQSNNRLLAAPNRPLKFRFVDRV